MTTITLSLVNASGAMLKDGRFEYPFPLKQPQRRPQRA